MGKENTLDLFFCWICFCTMKQLKFVYTGKRHVPLVETSSSLGGTALTLTEKRLTNAIIANTPRAVERT